MGPTGKIIIVFFFVTLGKEKIPMEIRKLCVENLRMCCRSRRHQPMNVVRFVQCRLRRGRMSHAFITLDVGENVCLEKECRKNSRKNVFEKTNKHLCQ